MENTEQNNRDAAQRSHMGEVLFPDTCDGLSFATAAAEYMKYWECRSIYEVPGVLLIVLGAVHRHAWQGPRPEKHIVPHK